MTFKHFQGELSLSFCYSIFRRDWTKKKIEILTDQSLRFLSVLLDNIMILKITNDFNLILNKDDYQAFVASIDLLSLHCPVCSAVGLFILYGHYRRFVIIDDISSSDCKIQIPVQRIQCTQCKSTHALLPTNFVPYTQFTYLFIYYIVTLDENDDLITSFEVALQTIRKVKARVIEFWDSLFPNWRDFKQNDLKLESLKRHNILFGSTRSYCKLCVLSPTEAQL